MSSRGRTTTVCTVTNKSLLESAGEFVKKELYDNITLVEPSCVLKDYKGTAIPASSLKMGKFESKDVHFWERDAQELFKDHAYAKLKSDVLQFFEIPTQSVFSKVVKCDAHIVGNLSRCETIRNEAELRYVIGDPLMEMLCDLFNLEVSFYAVVHFILDIVVASLNKSYGVQEPPCYKMQHL